MMTQSVLGKLRLIFILTFLHLSALGQPLHNMKGHHLWIIQERAPQNGMVFETKAMTYYGLDFSLFSISLKDSIESEKDKIGHIPAWILEFEYGWLTGSFETTLEKFFAKSLTGNKIEVQSSFQKLGDDWLHAPTNKLELDTLNYLLSTYPNSTKQTVGFTIVVESFEERSDRATVNFLFFDTKTKEIFWNLKMIGWGISTNEYVRWGKGLKNAFAHFKIIYNSRKKDYYKSKRKSFNR